MENLPEKDSFTLDRSKASMFKRLSFRKSKKSSKKENISKDTLKTLNCPLETLNTISPREEEQINEEQYENKLKMLRITYKKQQLKLNEMAVMCLQDAMAIEEKNKRILELEMKIISLKSAIAREREKKWSLKVASEIVPEDLRIQPHQVEASASTTTNKYDPIHEYLKMHVF